MPLGRGEGGDNGPLHLCRPDDAEGVDGNRWMPDDRDGPLGVLLSRRL